MSDVIQSAHSRLVRAQDYVVFMTSTFFHFVLRRETGPAVPRSPEEKSNCKITQASWAHVV